MNWGAVKSEKGQATSVRVKWVTDVKLPDEVRSAEGMNAVAGVATHTRLQCTLCEDSKSCD